MELNHESGETATTTDPVIVSPKTYAVPPLPPMCQAYADPEHSKALMDLLAAAGKENSLNTDVILAGSLAVAPMMISTLFPSSPAVPIAMLTLPFTQLFFLVRIGMRYRRTTEALAAADDVRIVGPLINRLRIDKKSLFGPGVVRQALTRLLPRLRASDASLITAEQQAHLSRSLAALAKLGHDTELQLAILAALQQVGGEQAVPVVEGLAHTSGERRVREAAQACLPYLQERAKHERSRNTLLRASSATARDGGQLLRSTEGSTTTGPEELLRAIRPDAEPPEETQG